MWAARTGCKKEARKFVWNAIGLHTIINPTSAGSNLRTDLVSTSLESSGGRQSDGGIDQGRSWEFVPLPPLACRLRKRQVCGGEFWDVPEGWRDLQPEPALALLLTG